MTEQSSAALRAIQEFVAKPQSWGILNGTPEDIEVRWGGESIVFPRCDRTVELHPKAATDKSYEKFVSHKDNRGYIPGTLVIHSLTRATVAGDIPYWDVKGFIVNKLGIDEKTGKCVGEYGRKGLMLFALDATRSELESLKNESHGAWESWAVQNAATTMSWWNEQRRAQVNSGLPEPVPPSFVNDAAILLKSVADKRGKAISDLLGGAGAPANQMIQQRPVPKTQEALSAEMLESLKAQIMADLLKDPEQLKALSAAVLEAVARVPAEKKAKAG
jgi:hypothetical protein